MINLKRFSFSGVGGMPISIILFDLEKNEKAHLPKKPAVAPKGMTMVLTMRSAKASETRNQLVTFWSGRSSQTAKHTRTLPTVPATTNTITQMNDQL